VLPFKPLLAGQHDPALSLGMADTLIAGISALPSLRVSPLGTVRRYGSLEQDPLAAGAELDVATVLEGTLQTHGGRLRLTARLLRVADGQSLWSGKFEVPANDIFEIQDSIATQVIEALRPMLGERMSLRAAKRQTQNVSAYKHYIAGLFNQLRRDIDGLPQAIRSYEAATLADPEYVRAWAGLSVTLAVQAVFGTRPPASVFPRAKEAALHAIALDPASPEGLGALGHVLVQYERKFEEGRECYLRARELQPDSAQLQLWIAINEAHLGRTDQAIEDVRRAIELEPRTLAFNAVLGMLIYFRRSYDEAIAHLQHLIGIEPRFDQARTFLGKAWLLKGEPERALEQFLARASTAPGSFADLGCAYALAGRMADARAEIARLRTLGKEGFGVSYDLAAVHLALGEVPKACECLEAAVGDHSQLIGFLRVDPMLDGLRETAAYARVFRRIYES
jgi:TolB-like protein/Flp pilus assembly protein TadD